MSTLRIITDGGCSNNQSDENIGGWGAVLTYKEQEKELYGGEINTTNNRMEMMALLEALKSLKRKDTPIEVYSDSAYLINCFQQKWYANWRKNGWKNSKKEPVENQDLWEDILCEVESIKDIRFFKIKGHLRLDDVAALKSWYKKYLDTNKCNHSYEYFLEICSLNHRADALAGKGIKEISST